MWTFISTSVILLSCGYVSQAQLLSPTQPIAWSLLESITGVPKQSIDCAGILKIDGLSPSHCSACFGVIPKGTGTFWLFYSPKNGALDYDKANLYTFSMSCDEGGGIKTNGTVILNVIPNFPPFFQDPSSFETVIASTTAGGVVYNPQAKDPEIDRLTFTLEENPNNGFFTIDGNGAVTAKKNLNTFCNQETVTITMQDGTNPPVSKTVTMDPGGNKKQTLTDLNRIMTIPENTELNLLLTDNLRSEGTCIVTVVPPEYSSYVDSTECPKGGSSRLKTKTFNFEVDPPINISLVFDNGNCPSDPRWLYLQWEDVPEQPKLTLDKMNFITKEGFVEIEPDYLIEDDDIQDKHVYSFAKPPKNPNFKIDPDTGRIYTQRYYKMDCNTDVNEIVFDVQVTDKNGSVSNSSVKVKLNLTDVNDNRPRFTKQFDPTPIPYPDCVEPRLVTRLSGDVKDDDCEVPNNAVEFVEASSGSLSITKDGVVRLTKPPIAGQVDILQIQAIDKGEPPLLSETETISVIGFPCPTTAPPVVPDPIDNNNNDNNNNNNNNNENNNNNNGVAATVVPAVVEAGFFDNPWNIALIALAGLLGLLLLPLLLYLCYRFCGPCCIDACYRLKNRPLKANRIKPNKMGGDDKGQVAQKEPEKGVSEAEGEVIAAKKKAMVGGKIIRYGGYVDEYGYSYSEAGGGGYGSGGGGYGYSSGGGGYGDGGESGYGGGEGVVVGDANEGKGDNGYWKEHFQDKGFKDPPSRKALPATVEKA